MRSILWMCRYSFKWKILFCYHPSSLRNYWNGENLYFGGMFVKLSLPENYPKISNIFQPTINVWWLEKKRSAFVLPSWGAPSQTPLTTETTWIKNSFSFIETGKQLRWLFCCWTPCLDDLSDRSNVIGLTNLPRFPTHIVYCRYSSSNWPGRNSTAIMASIFMHLHVANPRPLDRFLRFIVLCFLRKKKIMSHFARDAMFTLRDWSAVYWAAPIMLCE